MNYQKPNVSQSKKLNIKENENGLFVEIQWDRSISFLLFIVTILLFAAIFYILPDHFKFLPIFLKLFHIIPSLFFFAFGLLTLVGTLSNGLNTTHISLDNSFLKVNTSPISWKLNNVVIPVNKIEQFYIKESKSLRDGKSDSTHTLMVRLKDGTNQTIGVQALLKKNELIQLENRLEKYLGIQNQSIKGEADAVRTIPKDDSIMRLKRMAFDNYPEFNNKHLGDEILFDGSYQQIAYTNQHDWHNGNIDVQFQLSSPSKGRSLIYIKQNKGLHDLLIESKLELHQTNEIAFNEKEPHSQFEFNGILFRLIDFSNGNSFKNNTRIPVSTQQWYYQSANNDQSIRILSIDNKMHFYEGKLYDKDSDSLDDDPAKLELNRQAEKVLNQPKESDYI